MLGHPYGPTPVGPLPCKSCQIRRLRIRMEASSLSPPHTYLKHSDGVRSFKKIGKITDFYARNARFQSRPFGRPGEFLCKIYPLGAVSGLTATSMSTDEPNSLLTRASLLFRLRDWKDAASWEEFYRLYRRLVYGLARRSGLTHNEAEEVTQDVVKRVAETIHTFESDPKRGSFRGWLMNLTRWRIADKFRARRPDDHLVAGSRDRSATGSTGGIDQLADPRTNAMDDIWESEWQRNVLDVALARLARKVPAKQFQAFDLYARRNWSVLKVARELGINPASIYLISHRLTKQLRAEVDYLKSQLG